MVGSDGIGKVLSQALAPTIDVLPEPEIRDVHQAEPCMGFWSAFVEPLRDVASVFFRECRCFDAIGWDTVCHEVKEFAVDCRCLVVE